MARNSIHISAGNLTSRGTLQRQPSLSRSVTRLAALMLVLLAAPLTYAQQYPAVGGRQFPINQMTPPGTAAQWAVNAGRITPDYFQPVRVDLPAAGTVTFYESIDRPVQLAAPAQVGLLIGHSYRLKISGLEEFPGMDFYPSIELIDRLHPPTGREEDFPVTFEFTSEEFEWAANGRLVTKVVYLEQPQRLPTTMLDREQRIITIEPSRNALAEADMLGRPMAIVRLGGRMPDPHRPDPVFFGPGGPIRASSKTAPAPATQISPGVVRLSKPRSNAKAPQQTASKVQQVRYTQDGVITPECPPMQIQACPAEPRWAAPCRCETTYLAEKFPDEYLCDGGDRDLPVHYDRYNRNGLDTEDTVAEFTDHTGKNNVRATNRVCLYAPRFSTIRTVSRPHEGMNLDEVGGVGHAITADGMRARLKASGHAKTEMTGRVLVRSRASGLENEQVQGDVFQVKKLAVHEKLLNVYQDLNFVQFGKLERTEAARLNYGLQASLIWTREEYPIISAKTEMAMTGTYEAHAATIVGIDDKKSDEPGDLRVVKLADKQTAQTGDIVEFTIRYDNLGPNSVHHVRIVDNLTPRLAYVDDSATSDRDGRLVVQDNGEGSLVLVWELTNSLPPKTGGVVTFKARIR